MSGTQSDAPARGIIQKAKLVVKDLGKPGAVDDKKHSASNPLMLGVIRGKAFGIRIKVDAKGEAFEALNGYFEGIPADPNADIIASAVCYLPSGFHEIVTEQLRGRTGVEVQFAYDVGVVPANNPIGYSYVFKPQLRAQAAALLAIGQSEDTGFKISDRGAAQATAEAVKEPVKEPEKHGKK